MAEPDLVAKCVAAMQEKVNVPVTVKCRIGIDDQDDFYFLDRFIGTIADTGCGKFIIHARKAWLKGLSPKENREKPPLDYDRVAAIKQKYPEISIILNGGITDILAIQDHLNIFDGVMIGREAYQNPYFLAEIERKIFGNHYIKGREKIARTMMDYIDRQGREYGTPVKSITRHIIGLYHHQPGGRKWRQVLSEQAHGQKATSQVIIEALKAQHQSAQSRHQAA